MLIVNFKEFRPVKDAESLLSKIHKDHTSVDVLKFRSNSFSMFEVNFQLSVKVQLGGL